MVHHTAQCTMFVFLCLKLSPFILARLKQACESKRCIKKSKNADVARLVKGNKVTTRSKAKKLGSRGKGKTLTSNINVGKLVAEKNKRGKKQVRMVSGARRVLARRSTIHIRVGC